MTLLGTSGPDAFGQDAFPQTSPQKG